MIKIFRLLNNYVDGDTAELICEYLHELNNLEETKLYKFKNDFVNYYDDNWDKIVKNEKLDELFIFEFEENINMYELSCSNLMRLSEYSLNKYSNKINWDAYAPDLDLVSEEFLEKYI